MCHAICFGGFVFLKKRKSFFKSGAISNNIKATALPSSIFDWRDSIVRELTVGDIPTQRNVCVELFLSCVCVYLRSHSIEDDVIPRIENKEDGGFNDATELAE